MNGFHRDPYEILGVRRDATSRQIRRAYRRLAMKLHPDRNLGDPQAEERFKELQWAYDTLKSASTFPRASTVRARDTAAVPSGEQFDPLDGFFAAVRAHFGKRSKDQDDTAPKRRDQDTDAGD